MFFTQQKEYRTIHVVWLMFASFYQIKKCYLLLSSNTKHELHNLSAGLLNILCVVPSMCRIWRCFVAVSKVIWLLGTIFYDNAMNDAIMRKNTLSSYRLGTL